MVRLVVLLSVLAYGFVSQATLAERSVPIALVSYPEMYDVIKKALIDNDCKIDQPLGESPSYVVLEAILLCNALRSGGVNPEISIHVEHSQERALRGFERGIYFSASYSFWGADANQNEVYKSIDILEAGEFYKGIFVRKGDPLLRISSPNALKNKSSATNRLWIKDWNILNCLEAKMVEVTDHESMPKLLHSERIDFLLGIIPTTENHVKPWFNHTFYPIEGIKIVFDDSLNFLVSKHYPGHKMLNKALDKGLKKLKKEGVVADLYKRAGFGTESTQSWTKYVCKGNEFVEWEG